MSGILVNTSDQLPDSRINQSRTGHDRSWIHLHGHVSSHQKIDLFMSDNIKALETLVDKYKRMQEILTLNLNQEEILIIQRAWEELHGRRYPVNCPACHITSFNFVMKHFFKQQQTIQTIQPHATTKKRTRRKQS